MRQELVVCKAQLMIRRVTANMIKPFFKLLREINVTFGNLIIFSNILTAFLIFLIGYLLLSLIKFYPIIAVIPALTYFIADSYLRIRKKHYKEVENAYPELNEKLRTAADNLYKENPIVAELQKEIIQDTKHVRVSSFVNQRNVSFKILGSVILCFAILIVSVFNIGFDIRLLVDRPSTYTYLPGGESGRDLGEVSDARIAGLDEGDDDIFGESEVAELGQELFDFSISSSGYEINLNDVKEVERKDFQELFPGTDSIFSSASVYEENIPKEQQELVKNYFNKIK